jgi:hypothetical protein
MAGYFRKAEAFNYLGSEKAGEALTNGLFVEITGTGVKKIAADGDAEFRVAEKTTLWGLPALVLICVNAGSKEMYVTENEFEDYGDKGDFNHAEYSVPVGHYVKMRRPNINDELIVSTDATTYAALDEGDTVIPSAGGGVEEKA